MSCLRGNPTHKDTVPTSTKDTTYLDYGFYRTEIESKLNQAVEGLASKYQIVYSMRLDGETPYKEIPIYSGMEPIRGGGEIEWSDTDEESAEVSEDYAFDDADL